MMIYPCKKCGLCCQNLINSDLYSNLHDGNGICKHYNKIIRRCSIYNDRPIICRIDEYYEKYLKEILSIEEYYKKNLKACEAMKKLEENKQL